MARRVKEEAERTRTRILASALALFARKGYAHTTFTDIAARLNMTKGAVYWHFASKEALLMALVDEMLAKFHRQVDEIMLDSEFTFPAVAEMMTRHAVQIVHDVKARAFFLLMREQIQWSSASMDTIRDELMKDERVGPWRIFQEAVTNDRAAGRVRTDTDPVRIAHVCVAVWDGLLHAHIAGFMTEGMCEAIRTAFDAVWESIRIK